MNKCAVIITKTLIYNDEYASTYVQNTFFHGASEELITEVIMRSLSRYCLAKGPSWF